MKTSALSVLLCICASCAAAQSQGTAANTKDDPRSSPYYVREFARLAGNVGGWWNLLSENEKASFLDGYQAAMGQSYSQNMTLCKVVKDGVKPSSDQEGFTKQVVVAVGVCDAAKGFDGFEKITTKDLDGFYFDRLNQAILLEWAMGYLRDKASGRKTEGQLLDALRAEQKDVHDCSKYPHLCKLGVD
jgi:hypothetical protein